MILRVGRGQFVGVSRRLILEVEGYAGLDFARYQWSLWVGPLQVHAIWFGELRGFSFCVEDHNTRKPRPLVEVLFG